MTVFGPGVGECIVLHLGNGDWLIVDSCTSPIRPRPLALDYLCSIGVDPARSIRRIIATHWHDDHIQGMATILRECPNAEFVMSGALATEQFFQIVLEVDAQNRLVKYNSSASELSDILEILEERSRGSNVVGPHMFAQDGSRIFRGGHCDRTEVWALSPSAATVANAFANIADRLLTSGQCRRFKRFSPNDLSVAILVQAGIHNLLLGADLENTTAEQFGWKAVLRSTLRPTEKASVFKLAHHGSVNADHEGIWERMLVSQPAVVVTPYSKLAMPLPRESDVQRVKRRTDRVFCTTWPPTKQPARRRGVDGIVRGATKSRRALNKNSGCIRLRVDLSDPSAAPTIELFGSARQL